MYKAQELATERGSREVGCSLSLGRGSWEAGEPREGEARKVGKQQSRSLQALAADRRTPELEPGAEAGPGSPTSHWGCGIDRLKTMDFLIHSGKTLGTPSPPGRSDLAGGMSHEEEGSAGQEDARRDTT